MEAWLREDVGDGDLTTERVIPADAACEAAILVKERGIVCGLDLAYELFRELDESVRFQALASDGDEVEGAGSRRSKAPPAPILTGERTALNILGRLSGIATLTRRYVDAIEGTGRRDPRHAQDDARAARAGEVRGARAAAAATTASASTTGS